MRDRHKALAWKSWVALGIVLVLVGVALAQAQAQRRGRGARDPLRDQGGVPLKKARPEAADPLAKVAVVPYGLSRRHSITTSGSGRSTGRRWLPRSIPPSRLLRAGGHARSRDGPVAQGFRGCGAGAQGAGAGRAPPGLGLRRFQHGSALARPEPAQSPDRRRASETDGGPASRLFFPGGPAQPG